MTGKRLIWFNFVAGIIASIMVLYANSSLGVPVNTVFMDLVTRWPEMIVFVLYNLTLPLKTGLKAKHIQSGCVALFILAVFLFTKEIYFHGISGFRTQIELLRIIMLALLTAFLYLMLLRKMRRKHAAIVLSVLGFIPLAAFVLIWIIQPGDPASISKHGILALSYFLGVICLEINSALHLYIYYEPMSHQKQPGRMADKQACLIELREAGVIDGFALKDFD